jgi:quinol monooxygenase YgiN
MVYEILRYRIGPNRAAEFLQACSETEVHLRESPHLLSYDLSRCADAPQNFVLMIGWDSVEMHLENLQVARKLGAFRRSARPFSQDIWDCVKYDPIAPEEMRP